jgi:transposase
VTEDDLTKLRVMWKAGKKRPEIAAELKVDVSTVSDMLRKVGLVTGHYDRTHCRRQFTEEQVAAVRGLLDAGTLTLKTAKAAAKVSEERAKELIWQVRQGTV